LRSDKSTSWRSLGSSLIVRFWGSGHKGFFGADSAAATALGMLGPDAGTTAAEDRGAIGSHRSNLLTEYFVEEMACERGAVNCVSYIRVLTSERETD
jgi:hypothetical protein